MPRIYRDHSRICSKNQADIPKEETHKREDNQQKMKINNQKC
jgi:hypothetical protein